MKGGFIVVGMFILGLIIGGLLMFLLIKWKVIGHLIINTSDPEDGPYMFLELDKSVDDVYSRKYVLFKVKQQ